MTLDYPKITIITPTLNQADFINETIQSVLNQGYPNIEYIIVDGGSTDGTKEILESYDGRIRWISEKDRGQSDAINKGLRMASGQVIAFLNSDDLYEPGALLDVGAFFAKNPDAFWLTGWCRVIDPQGVEIRKLITLYKKFWLLLHRYEILIVMDYISQPATFWRKEVIEKVGVFNENLHYAMDYDYFLRVGKYFKLWVRPRYLASYRIHPNSKAGSSAHAQFDSTFKIAQSHSNMKLLIWLHSWHNRMIVFFYRRLQEDKGDNL
jgi:glycosyltransferase involved in cell wall biosynthesis